MWKKIIIKISDLEKNISDHPGRWLIGVILFLIIISGISLVVLIHFFKLEKDSFPLDLAHTFLEIISVGVIGTILTLLLNEQQNVKTKNEKAKEIREQIDENKNQFRKDILHKLIRVYLGTKSERRLLRARAFKMPYEKVLASNEAEINLQIYDHALENINAFQLDLEAIISEITTDSKIFKNQKRVTASISQMQEYLHSLVKEYEDNRGKANADFALMVADLGKIKKLIDHAHNTSTFRDEFIIPFKTAIAIVRQELIGNESVAQGKSPFASAERNKAIVRRFFDEVCNGKDLKIIYEIFDKEVSFNGNPGTYKDVINYVQEIRNAFMDAHVEINKQLAEEDRVSTMRTWTGTQIKKYRQHPPTNKLMKWTEVSVVRLEDGKVVEDWVVRNELTVADSSESFQNEMRQ